MRMSETLEQVVLGLPCDGATTLAIIGALKEAGLADAHIIRGTCKTCGGSGFVLQRPQHPAYPRYPCPDCPPTYVIAPEAGEALDAVLLPHFTSDVVREKLKASVAQALLPGARVAKEVGFIEWSGATPKLRVHLRRQDGGSSSLYASEAIAILSEQEGR